MTTSADASSWSVPTTSFPAPHAIIRAQIAALGGSIVGEDYLLLGDRNVEPVVRRIVAAKPSVILNTLNGDTNVAFFEALRAAGITPRHIPTVSFSFAENEILSMDPKLVAGDYASWSYFQSIDSPDNARFVARFKRRFGQARAISDSMEAAYFGVQLWAQAAGEAHSADAAQVRRFLARQRQAAPEGNITIDSATNHTWKAARIGRIREDGQFDIVWMSPWPIRPVPYPLFRPQSEWDGFLTALYDGWGQQWANPAKVRQ